jgi:hypothetical protein
MASLTMNPNDDIASQIWASIAALPLHEQADAIHALLGSVIKHLPLEGVLQIREEIVSEFEEDIPIVRSALELIDGQLALREIAGRADWR